MALFLNESDVRGLLTMKECIDALETAFIHSSTGMAENVPRRSYSTAQGLSAPDVGRSHRFRHDRVRLQGLHYLPAGVKASSS